MTSREFQDRLARRAKRGGVALPPLLASQLEVYFRLLTVWNEKINLTGFDPNGQGPSAIDRLLVEPVVAAKHVSQRVTRMIDIGSGGGSPAIPLALALSVPGLLLVESKTRKSVFLREALRALEMNDADVATSRFEELLSRPDLHEAHQLLTLRAVRVEGSVLMNLQAFVKPGGDIFLFKSSAGAATPETLVPPLAWTSTLPLLESQGSRLVVLSKRENSNHNVSRGTSNQLS